MVSTSPCTHFSSLSCAICQEQGGLYFEHGCRAVGRWVRRVQGLPANRFRAICGHLRQAVTLPAIVAERAQSARVDGCMDGLTDEWMNASARSVLSRVRRGELVFSLGVGSTIKSTTSRRTFRGTVQTNSTMHTRGSFPLYPPLVSLSTV